MSDSLERIERCYEKYVKDVQKVIADSKPVDGLLGLGDDPSKHPCHEVFYYKVESEIREIASIEKNREEIAQIVSYMIRAEIIWEADKDVIWMMIAASGHAVLIIPRLSPQDAKKLYKLYNDIVPRFKRLPVQKKIAACLKAAAKE